MFLAQLLKIESWFLHRTTRLLIIRHLKKRVTKQKINIADKLRHYGSIFLHE